MVDVVTMPPGGDHQRSGPAVTVRTPCHCSAADHQPWPWQHAGTELRKLYFVIVLPVKRSLKLTSNSHKSSLHNFTYHLSSHPLTSVLPWSGIQIKCGSNAQSKLFTCRLHLARVPMLLETVVVLLLLLLRPGHCTARLSLLIMTPPQLRWSPLISYHH